MCLRGSWTGVLISRWSSPRGGIVDSIRRPPSAANTWGPSDSPIRAVAGMAERTCSIEGCEGKFLARGLCRPHYARWRAANAAPCTVEGCDHLGRQRGLCGMHYQRVVAHGSTDLQPRSRPTPRRCCVDGCERSGSGSHGMCLMHAKRWKRSGTTDTRPVGEPPPPRRGRYHRVFVGAGHPLAHARGTVWAHRLALYEAIGPDPTVCHWCSTQVRWDSRWPKDADGLCADHLDNDRENNSPSNLVASCGPCNVARQPARS